jgi:uncharacterized repeat protein (TIGR02543 family)
MKQRKSVLHYLIAACLLLFALSVTVSADYTLTFNAGSGEFIDPDTGKSIGDTWKYKVPGMNIQTMSEDILAMADLWEYTGTGSTTLKAGPGLRKDGYVLAGWYRDAALKKKGFSDQTAHFFKNFKFYAKWVPATDAYTWRVTFDMNGERIYPDLNDLTKTLEKVTFRVAKGEPILEQRDRALRYATKTARFCYWSYDKAGNKPVNAPGAVVPKGNMTFYAQYDSDSSARSIGLTKSALTMNPGQKMTLTLTNPDVIKNVRLYWSSSNPSAVWVDQNGVLTACDEVGVADENALITVSEYGQPNSYATCRVTIPSKKKSLTVVNLKTKKENVAKKSGTKITLTAEKADAGRTFDKWKFSTSVKFTDGTYGTTSSKKKVSFYMPSKGLTVQATDKALHTKGVKLNKKTLNLAPGGKAKLVPKMKPAGAVWQTMLWWSSNSAVATVDEKGVVRAVGGGTCKVTVTVDGKYKASCTVKVKRVKAKKAVFQKKTLTLKNGKTYKLKLKVTPKNAVYDNLLWFSSNSRVATLTEGGVIHTHGKGKCQITCTITTVGGKKLKAKLSLTVK